MEDPDFQKSDPALSIRLFGPFDVRVYGIPLPPLRTRKGQWLLALLVLRSEKQVSRAWLAGTLWPQSGEEEALRNLRQSLYDLRRALGQQAHRLHAATQNTLGLEMNGAFVDVAAFDTAIQQGDISSLEQAVRLYRGPLLEGYSAEWALQERQVREQAYLQALETLAQTAMEQGDTGTAVCHLRAIIAVDPLRESAQRSLIQALADGGDFAAAAQVYRDLRLFLHRELHSEPDPQTAALFERLRRQARSGAGTPSAAAKAASAGSTIPQDASSLVHALPDALRTPQARLNNLPRQLSSFIGREKEIDEVKRLLSTSPLVTLTGTGGCGKTRLALQVATEMLELYLQGIWLVELAPLSDPGLVVQAVATSLGLRESPGQPLLQTLIDYLQPRTLLLLLDNCEHLIAACATLIETLLQACPNLCILATSREGLQIGGESTYRVPSLSPPDPSQLPAQEKDLAAIVLEYDAARLFVERAGKQQPSFAMTQENALMVAWICHRLDGIPLAIELAAACVRSLSVQEINARLDHRFRLLKGGSRTAPPRQQTLQATLDWSYDLLTEQERLLLCRLCVFAGGWTLEAAERVCSDEQIEAFEILDLLTSLVNKSLVISKEREGESRYRLLETIREYGLQRLQESEQEKQWRARHLEFFLQLAEEAENQLTGAEQAEWFERLQEEHDNLRTALQWCQIDKENHETGLRLAGALWRFWDIRGYSSEGREHLQAALSQETACQKTLARAKALNGAGNLAKSQGDHIAARALYEESLTIRKVLGDKQGIANTLNNLGVVAIDQGDYAAARILHEQSLAIRQEIGDKWGIAHSLNNLGRVARDQGDHVAARALYEESLTIRTELGDKQGIALSLNNLGIVARDQGDNVAGRNLHEQSLAIQRELGDKWGIALSLFNLGNIANSQGDYAVARALHEQSLAIRKELGDKSGIAYSLNNLGRVAHRQSDYAAAHALYEESLATFRELGNKQGIADSLHSLGHAAYEQGDYAVACTLMEQSLAISRELGDKRGIASSLNFLGLVARAQGDHASARTLQEESLAIYRELGDKWGIAWSFNNLGVVAYEQVEYDIARGWHEQSLVLFRELGNKQGIVYSLENLAKLAVVQGQAERASWLWAAAGVLREVIGSPIPPNDKESYDLQIATARTALGKEAFAVAWEQGRAMTIEQAIEYALEEPA